MENKTSIKEWHDQVSKRDSTRGYRGGAQTSYIHEPIQRPGNEKLIPNTVGQERTKGRKK